MPLKARPQPGRPRDVDELVWYRADGSTSVEPAVVREPPMPAALLPASEGNTRPNAPWRMQTYTDMQQDPEV